MDCHHTYQNRKVPGRTVSSLYKQTVMWLVTWHKKAPNVVTSAYTLRQVAEMSATTTLTMHCQGLHSIQCCDRDRGRAKDMHAGSIAGAQAYKHRYSTNVGQRCELAKGQVHDTFLSPEKELLYFQKRCKSSFRKHKIIQNLKKLCKKNITYIH